MDYEDRIAEARAVYGEQLESSLRRIVATLSAMEEVERVSLFGSYGRGRADLFTDLDLLVVMRTAEGILERLRRLYSLLAAPVDLDILCYTPEELEGMKDRPFVKRILKEERVLYEKRSAG
ncbi:MAG: nucleotidyltransferase domain-containing protein [Acidobacteria bacterium]|nr:nucleotidyltransferase domain-containing protein [Acidobacteriota bacterium]